MHIVKGKEVKRPMKKMRSPKVLISGQTIQRRVAEVAVEIDAFYADKVSADKPLVIVVVMKGAMYFAVDLTRHLTIPFVIRAERVESSWKHQERGGVPIIHDPLSQDLSDRHVLVVEDLIDSGDVIDAIDKHYSRLNPLSLNVVTVVIKRGAQANGEILNRVKWCCFPNVDKKHWLVGYGMDHEGQFRQLPHIGFYIGNRMPKVLGSDLP